MASRAIKSQPLMRPLTRDEARAALRMGHGRVVLHLCEFGAEWLQDDLLGACLHSLVYDAQCEGTRGEWLTQIIHSPSSLTDCTPK